MNIECGFKFGENVFSKQKIQYWLNSDTEICWHAFIWYISQFVELSDFSENDITVEMHAIGDHDFFVETSKDYNDVFARYNYQLALLSDSWRENHKNADLNNVLVERLIHMDKIGKGA